MDHLSTTSGAAKKRKKQKLEAETSKMFKISTFFPVIPAESLNSKEESVFPSITCSAITASVAGDRPNVQDMAIVNDQASTSSTSKNETMDLDKFDPATDNITKNSTCYKTETDNLFLSSLAKETFPCDKGNFKNHELSDKLKMFIVTQGPCQPIITFPKDNSNRSFSTFYYSKKSHAGQIILRKWLCYSAIDNKAYCEPCWLFSTTNTFWKQGTSDWKGLSKKVKFHEQSQYHITCCYIYDHWKSNKCIDKALEETIRNECNFWQKILQRLIDITLILAKNSLAFRGHRETIDQVYNGNFLTQVNFLAKYDLVMRELVSKPKGTINYLSPTIQNELIDCLANTLEKRLVSKINESLFFSIIMDTTQDITKVDQLSKIIRYVEIEKDENGKPQNINIIESFMGFTKVSDQSAAGLTSEILESLKALGLSIKKCRGQGYDGAKVMSGIYSGVQKRIKDIEPTAAYIHCTAHNLNLVINDAVSGVKEVASFFLIIADLYTFFGSSINRWDLLASFSGESEVKLKRLNPTRWAGRIISLLAVKLRFGDIIKALTKISLISTKPDERGEAIRLLKAIENFEFIMILTICCKILEEINLASQILQAPQLDLSKASKCLKMSLENLKNYRNKYEDLKTDATSIAKRWNISPLFREKRQHKPKKQYDEYDTNYLFYNQEYYFKVNIYYKVFDIVINQLNNRFEGMEKTVDKFSFLSPPILVSMTEEELFKSAEALQQCYPRDISSAFPLQIVALSQPLKNKIGNLKGIKEFAHFLIVENDTLASNFAEVYTALILFLTLPVTVASSERSFSKLKVIKNYLRNCCSQNRLSNLALLSIEAKEAAAMDKTELIKVFAETKSRRKQFLE